MAHAVRTTLIKNVILNVVIRRIVDFPGFTETIADAHQIEDVDDSIAIHIRVDFSVPVDSFPKGIGNQHQVLDIDLAVFIDIL